MRREAFWFVALVLACGFAIASSAGARSAVAYATHAAATNDAVSAARRAQAASGLPRGVPYASNTDAVSILSVTLSSQYVTRGETVSAVVVTTSNAAALTARTGTIRVWLDRPAFGIFTGKRKVPWWAPSGSHLVTFTAVRTDGATAEYTLSVRVR